MCQEKVTLEIEIQDRAEESDRLSKLNQTLQQEKNEFDLSNQNLDNKLKETEEQINQLSLQIKEQALEITLAGHDKEIMMLNMETLVLTYEGNSETETGKLLVEKLAMERELSRLNLKHEAEIQQQKMGYAQIQKELDRTKKQISEYKLKVDEKVKTTTAIFVIVILV